MLRDKIDAAVLDRAGPSLKIVSTMSVGYDHIDVVECARRGITVGYTPDVLTDATADLAMTLLLCTSRRIPEAMAAVRDGTWGPWEPTWMCGKGLQGATAGIVGLGRIGQAVARRLRAFGIGALLYTGTRPNDLAAQPLSAEWAPLEALLARSDYVVVTAALNERTQNLFNSATFARMKASSVFINVARGGLVQQDDLVEALRRGVIGAAGLDVTTPEPLPVTHPLLALPNCVVFPHIGSATMETREAMGRLAVENALAAVRGLPIPHKVTMQQLKV